MDRSDGIAVGLGITSFVIAVTLPLFIFAGQAQAQRKEVCTTAILELRKELAIYYSYGADSSGMVKEANHFDQRAAVQGARDTVYAACIELKDKNGRPLIDPASDPWTQSPSSIFDQWSYNNVNNVYESSAAVLSEIVVLPTWHLGRLALG